MHILSLAVSPSDYYFDITLSVTKFLYLQNGNNGPTSLIMLLCIFYMHVKCLDQSIHKVVQHETI